ncbi:YfhO family protein [Flavitalea flava]
MNSPLLKKALPHVIAILVFLVVAVVYCKPALEGKVVSQSDMVNWKGMAQKSFEYKEKHGHFPLWTESAFGGMPAYTIAIDPTSNVSIGYVGYLLNPGLPQPINFFFLACICFYILTQVIRINPWIGILGALAYAYSTYDPVIIVTGHVTKMIAIAYAPAVIASLLLIFQRKYIWGMPLLTIFLGLQIGSQHLQIVYYTLITMGLLTVFYLIHSFRQKQIKDAAIGLVISIFAGVIAFATSMTSTLAIKEYTKETMRGGRTELTNTNSKIEGKDGLNKDYAFQWSYGLGETFTLAVPGIYGGSNGGKEIGDNSKFAEKLSQEFSMPQENALQYANGSAYWGAQPFTQGPVYLGGIICLLFLFALVFLKGWQKWWLVSVAVVGIALSWGKNFPALNYFLFDHLPFYNKFRAPSTSLVMPQFAFPLLGALGLNELLYGGESNELIWKKFKTAAFIVGGLLIVLTGFYFMNDYKGVGDAGLKERFLQGKMQMLSQGKQPGQEIQAQANETANALMKDLQSDRQSLYGADLIRTILLMAAAAALLGLYIKGKLKSFVLIAGLTVLSTYDLLAIGTRYLNQESFIEQADFESSFTPTAADLQIKADPDQNFRVFDQSSQSPFEDARTSYHHNSIGGYSPAKLGLYQDIIDGQLSKGNMQVYNMLNTKYFIQSDPATRQPQARINPAAFGPCWLVKGIHFVKDGNEEMKALDSVNVRDTAIIQQKFASLIKFQPEPDSAASIRLTENLNDKLTYKFSARTNQFAVFSEVYYDKGWEAYLDGKKTDYLRVNYILRGVPVPAGEHSIEFRFEPHAYYLGNTLSIWSSLFTYLLLIGAIVIEWRRWNTARQKGNPSKEK